MHNKPIDPLQTDPKAAFKTAYDTLQKNAQALQNSQEPNIDELMTIVEEAIAAYKVCQSRIDAVEKSLNQAFE